MQYIKIEEPFLYKTENDNDFLIITHTSFENMKYGLINFKGKKYNYDEGVVSNGEEVEMQMSLTEDSIFSKEQD